MRTAAMAFDLLCRMPLACLQYTPCGSLQVQTVQVVDKVQTVPAHVLSPYAHLDHNAQTGCPISGQPSF
jgi:hypothetical protein